MLHVGVCTVAPGKHDLFQKKLVELQQFPKKKMPGKNTWQFLFFFGCLGWLRSIHFLGKTSLIQQIFSVKNNHSSNEACVKELVENSLDAKATQLLILRFACANLLLNFWRSGFDGR